MAERQRDFIVKRVLVRKMQNIFLLALTSLSLIHCSVKATVSKVGDAGNVTPNVTINDLALNEGTTGALVIQLDAAPVDPISIAYKSMPGSAHDNVNYVHLDSVLTIPAGATSATIPITALHDSLYEGDMTFTVQFTPPGSAVIPSSMLNKTVTIHDIDPKPQIQFQLASDSVTSNVIGGSYTANITLSGAARDPISVNLAPTAGTAVMGTDYSMALGGLIIPSGATTATSNVSIINTGIYKPSVDFVLTLSSPSANATLGAQNSTDVTILQSTTAPTVEFAAASGSVNNNVAGGVFQLPIQLNHASSTATTVSYSVGAGTAQNNVDYVLAATGTLTIAPLTTAVNLPVTILNTGLAAPNVVLNLSLSGTSANASVGTPNNYSLTIVNTNLPPTVQFQAASTSGSFATSPHSIVANLSSAAGVAVTVNYSITGGTAINGTDYNLSAGTLTFAAGATSATISMPVINNHVWHPGGGVTVQLTLAAPSGATLGAPAITTHNLLDSVSQPILNINNVTALAGSGVSFVVASTQTSTAPIVFNFTTGNGTAAQPADYTLTAGSATIAAGATSVTLPSVSTNISSGGKTFTMGLSAITVATAGTTTGTATMIPDPTLNIGNVSTMAGTSANFVVTLSQTSTLPITFNYATADGSASQPADYTLQSGSATIAAGQTTLTLPGVATNGSSSGKNFSMSITNIANGVGGLTSGLATMTAQPTLSVNSVSTNAGTNVNFVTSLSMASPLNVVFNYATANGTASSPADYSSQSGTVTILAGQTSLTLPAIATNVSGGGKNFTLGLTAITGAVGGVTSGTASLIVMPTISIANTSAMAGTNANFVVSVTAASPQNITFNYLTADGTAHQPADYSLSSGTATIIAGATSVTLPGAPTFASGNGKNFTMTISAIANAVPGTNVGTATISSLPALAINNISTNAGSNVAFVTTLSQASALNTVFTYATADGTAAAPADYSSTTGTATILAGATTLTLPNVATNNSGGGKNFAMNLSNITNAISGTSTGIASLFVVPTINMSDVTTMAGANVNFVVTLSATTTHNITFNFASSDGTAHQPGDYTSASGSATILAGQSSATLSYVTTASAAGKNFSVSLSNLVNAIAGTTTGTATLTAQPTIWINNLTVNAGSPATFIVNLTGDSVLDTVFTYATNDGTAHQPADYNSATATATIAAGATAFTLPAVATQLSGGGKSFTMVLSSILNATAGATTGTANLNLMPTISVGNVTANAGATANFVVGLSAASPQNIVFNYATSNGTATQPADYTSISNSATILAGATAFTLPVTTNLSSGGKNFNMTISGITNAVAGVTTGVATINVMPTLNINNVTANAGTSVPFVVTLSQASPQAISFNYTTTDGTALQPADYNLTSGTATISAGSTSLTLPSVATQLSSGGKNFTMHLSNIVNGLAGTTVGTATMNLMPQVSIGNVNVAAGAAAVFTVTLSVSAPQDLTFNYATADGTAHQPGDYTTASATGTIVAGATSLTLSVPTTSSGAGKNFTVTLSNVNNGVAAALVGTATILPALSINNISIAVGASGSFTATLGAAAPGNVVFNYATSDGTATQPVNYSSQSGTATILAGNTSVVLPAVSTTNTSGGLNFNMTLSSVTGASLGALTGVASVLNPTVIYRSVGVNSSPLACGAAGNGTGCSNIGALTITGTIATFASALPLNVGVGDAIQYNVAGTWYIAFINGRMSSTQYSVQANNGGTPQADSADTSWSIYRAYNSFHNAAFKAGLSSYVNQNINANVINFEATSGKGSLVSNNLKWNFALYADGPDTTSASVVTGWQTSALQSLRYYTPYLPTEVGQSQRHNGTWDQTKYYIQSGSNGYVVQLRPSYVTVEGIQVLQTGTDSGIQIAGGGPGHDTLSSNIIQNSSGSVGISGISDQSVGNNYFFNNIIYGFSGASSYGIHFTSNSDYVYNNTLVNNNVNLYSQTISSVYAKNNIAIGGVVANYSGAFGAGSNYNISSDATSTGGAQDKISQAVAFVNAAGSDYLLSPNDTSALDAGVDVSGDPNLAFSTDISGLGRPQGSAWDIGASEAVQASGNATEMLNLSFNSISDTGFNAVATFNGDSNNSNSAILYYCDNTATPGCLAQNGLSASMSRIAGQFSASVTGLTALHSYNVLVAAADQDGISNADLSATLTAQPALSIAPISVNAGSNANFVVSLSSATAQTVTFSYYTSDATATQPTSYTSTSGTATITAGNSSVTLPAVATFGAGGGKYFNMYIWNSTGASISNIFAAANLIAVPNININNVTTMAGSNVNFVVTLSATGTQNVVFNYATANGTATQPTNYTSLSGTATIAAGATTLTLPAVTTQTNAGGDYFTMNLSGISNANAGTIVGTANLNAVPVLSVGNVTVAGGATVSFVATMSMASASNVTFNYTTADGTAAHPANYTMTSGTATILAGATSLTLPSVATFGSGDGKNFTMVLSALTNATGGSLTGTASIVPNLSLVTPTYAQAGSPEIFVVTLDNPSAMNVTFNYATANGTASQPANYTSSTGSATILAGATSATLPNIATNSNGGGLNFNLNLTSITNAIGVVVAGTAYIQNPPKQIFRSIGFNNTTALSTGSGNAVTIAGTTATFASGLPNNIGVGDAIQYQVASTWYVSFISGRTSSNVFTLQNAAGGAPTATSGNSGWSIFRAYTSSANAWSVGAGTPSGNAGLNAAIRNFDTFTSGRNIVSNNEQWNFAYYADAAETISAGLTLQPQWVTSSANYIRFYAPTSATDVGVTQRHGGAWSPVAATISLTTSTPAPLLSLGGANFIFDGLQLVSTVSGASASAWGVFSVNNSGATVTSQISNNILQVIGTATASNCYGVNIGSSVADKFQVYNNILYTTGTACTNAGLSTAAVGTTNYFYNNTIVNFKSGFNLAASTNAAKNNIVQGATTGFSGTFTAGSDYNVSNDATSSGGAHDTKSAAVSFANGSQNDYRLSSSDLVAYATGVNLAADPGLAFSTDIQGHTRPSNWSRGAQEPALRIFRSIGPNNTSVLACGGSDGSGCVNQIGNLTITGTTATFASSLPGNIGVGDVIVYDSNSNGTLGSGDSVAFISGRTSSTVYTLQNNVGASPTAYSTAKVWRIYRAYTSFANSMQPYYSMTGNSAITAINATLGAYDSSFSGDLVTPNWQWNFAIYGDAADTEVGGLVPFGFSTSTSNTLRYYAPYLATEVGESQRHNGVWSNYAARIVWSANSNTWLINGQYTQHIVIEGLEISATETGGNPLSAIQCSGIFCQITDNLIQFPGGPAGATYSGIAAQSWDMGLFIIANNIIYFTTPALNWSDAGITTGSGAGTSIIYNNTVVGSSFGYNLGGSPNDVIFKNNVAQSSVNYDFNSGTLDSASTNNLTGDATSPTVSLRNKTVTFLNAAGRDYRLSPTDVSARAAGVNLSADANYAFNVDDKMMARPATWDLGADQSFSSSQNNIFVSNLTSTVASATSFNAQITFVGDANSNSSALLYYCDATLYSACDPLLGSSTTMSRGAGVYTSTTSGLLTGHTYTILALASDADGVVGSPLVGAVTPQPSISIGNIVVAGGSAANFVVNLSASSYQNVIFHYATSNGTATQPTNYTALSGTATILAGATTLTLPSVTTQVSGNGSYFNMTLSALTNVQAGTIVATGTMTSAATLSIGNVSTAAGTTANFVATLSQTVASNVTFNYATSDGTATQPTAYTASSGTATILAGSTSATLPVTTFAAGGNLNFNMSISAVVNATAGVTTGIASLSALPSLSIANVTTNAATPANFIVTLSSSAASNVTFSYATSDGTATQPTGYTQKSGTATIAAGNTSTTIAVTTLAAGAGKNFNMTISAPTNAILGSPTVGLATLNPNLSLPNPVILAGTTANFVVTANAVSASNITFSYATANGTATAGTHYTASSGTATLLAGQTSLTLPVATSVSGYGRYFTMTLSSITGATAIGANPGYAHMTPNNGWTVEDGASGVNNTYVAVNGTGDVFILGSASGTIDGQTATLYGQYFLTKYNSSGTWQWTVEDGASAGGTTPTAVTVDPSGNIIVTGHTAASLDGQTQHGSYDLFISKYNSSGVRQWTVQDGVATGTTEAFAVAADSSGNIYLTGLATKAIDGQTKHGTQDMFITMYDTTGVRKWTIQDGATGGTTNGRGIAADSNYVYATGTTNVAIDGQTHIGSDFYITKYDTSGNRQWTIEDGTSSGLGIAGSNLALDSNSNILVTGQINNVLDGVPLTSTNNYFLTKYTSAGARLWTVNDGIGLTLTPYALAVDQSNNAYIVGYTQGSIDGQTQHGATDAFYTEYTPTGVRITTLQDGGATGYTYGYGIAVDHSYNVYMTGTTNVGLDGRTLVSSDYFVKQIAAPPTTIDINNVTVNAGTSAAFVVTLSSPSASNVTFNYATADGTAANPANYTASSGTATILAGATAYTLPVATQISGGGLNFTMNLSSVTNATNGVVTGTANLNVIPYMSVANANALAGSGAAFIVSLSQASAQNITFNYATSDGTATSPANYTASSGTATILAGATTYTLPAVATSAGAGGLNFNMSLNSIVNAVGSTTTGVASIIAVPSISVNSLTVNAGTPAVFVATLTSSIPLAVTFNYATEDGTATHPTNYANAAGTATIAAGQTTFTLPVATQASGAGKYFTLVMSNLVNANAGSITGTASLISYPVINLSGVSVTAGQPIQFVATLSAATSQNVVFNYATSDGTAVQPTHYTALSGTATILAGQTSATLPSIATQSAGAGLYFDLALSNIANATAGVITATGSLTTLPTINIASIGAVAGAPANFVATLTQTSTTAVTFNYATGGGTATAGTDYTSLNGTATIAAGATTFTMPVTTASTVNGKTFNMVLSAVSNANSGTLTGTATFSNITLSINNISINAGGTGQFVVSLSSAAGGNVTFSYATSNGTAVQPTNYTTLSGSATITTGNTSFTLPAATTINNGGGLYFNMTLSAIVGAGSGSIVGKASILAPTKVYRSMGYNNTSALAVGTSNAVTINSNTATFSSALPLNIGVGDAIQYQVAGTWYIAFICGIKTPTQYCVQNNNGGAAFSDGGGDTSWSIYRAYTSLANVLANAGNASINANVRGFDTSSNLSALATNNLQANYALYGDAVDNEGALTTVAQGGSASQFTRFYTPYLPTEVGVSQRHNGVWSNNAYTLNIGANTYGFKIATTYLVFEGLQVTGTSGTSGYFWATVADGSVFDSNILQGNATASAKGFLDQTGLGTSHKTYYYNNIVSGFSGTTAYGILKNPIGSASWLYNNTFVGNTTNIKVGIANSLYAKNNIATSPGAGGNYVGTFNAASDYNISSSGTATGGAHDKINQTVAYMAPGSFDYRLSPTDTAALDAGTNLSADANLAFATDIAGLVRPQGSAWDIGASEVVQTSGNATELELLTISGLTTSGFTATATFSGDHNADNSAILYYCDSTAVANCNPVTMGTSAVMTRSAGQFTATVFGLQSSDVYNVEVIAQDPDGVSGVLSTTATISNTCGGSSPFARVQTVPTGCGSGTTCTIFNNAISKSQSITATTGNLVVAIAYAGQVTNGAYTPPNTKFTLTDTRGNTWYPGPIVTNPTGMVSAEQMFYAQNFNGGAASTVTATLANGSGNYSVGLVLYEFSGVATSNAVDISSSFVPTVASSTGNAGTINTRTSCDLVVAGILDGNVNGQYVYSGGGGFTEAIQDEWFPAGFLDNSATGSAYGATVSATLTGMLPADSDWVGTQMAFRASTTSALPQPTQLAFATSGQTVSHNTCSAVVTVSTLDSGSNLTTTSAGAVVTLSGAGLTYYADSTCTYPITTATIGAGSSGVSFYYKAAAVGSPVISAAATGYTTITQTETSN